MSVRRKRFGQATRGRSVAASPPTDNLRIVVQVDVGDYIEGIVASWSSPDVTGLAAVPAPLTQQVGRIAAWLTSDDSGNNVIDPDFRKASHGQDLTGISGDIVADAEQGEAFQCSPAWIPIHRRVTEKTALVVECGPGWRSDSAAGNADWSVIVVGTAVADQEMTR